MELSEHLVRVVDELIDAHDDTVRLADEGAPDWRWEAHVCYLRRLRRLGCEALAAATADEGDRRCARNGLGKGPA
jgi:hypothetical protein